MARAHQYVLNFRVFRQNLAELVERFDENERDKAAFTLAFASDIRKVVDYLIADADAIAAFETDQVIVVDLTDPLAARWLIETARGHELFHRLGEEHFDALVALAQAPAAEAPAEAWERLLAARADASEAPAGIGLLLRMEMAPPPAPEPEPEPEPELFGPEETVAAPAGANGRNGADHADDAAARPKRVRRGLISSLVSAARRSDDAGRIQSTLEAMQAGGETALDPAAGLEGAAASDGDPRPAGADSADSGMADPEPADPESAVSEVASDLAGPAAPDAVSPDHAEPDAAAEAATPPPEAPPPEAPPFDGPPLDEPAFVAPPAEGLAPEEPAALVEQARELVFWNIGAGSSQLFVEVGYKLVQERLPELADYFDLLRRLAIGESTRKSVIEHLVTAQETEDARWRVFWC